MRCASSSVKLVNLLPAGPKLCCESEEWVVEEEVGVVVVVAVVVPVESHLDQFPLL